MFMLAHASPPLVPPQGLALLLPLGYQQRLREKAQRHGPTFPAILLNLFQGIYMQPATTLSVPEPLVREKPFQQIYRHQRVCST